MTRPVTVGVDGSPAGLAAADWGAREARLRGVPLRLVHAWEWQPYSHAPPTGPEAALRWSKGIPREVTAQLHQRYPHLDITADRLIGPPREVLCKAAQEAELLVIDTVGTGRLTGFLLGSVALATVAHADRPIVLVRARTTADDDQAPAGAVVSVAPVVLGLDLLRPCHDVIRFAFESASLRAAPLFVLHGWNPPAFYDQSGISDPGGEAEITTKETETMRDVLGPWRERYPSVEVTEHAVIGQPAHHLLDASTGADLVVIGRRTRTAKAVPRIGHIAHAVLHHCPAPVAVVPHD